MTLIYLKIKWFLECISAVFLHLKILRIYGWKKFQGIKNKYLIFSLLVYLLNVSI